jgi:hypothetical protein
MEMIAWRVSVTGLLRGMKGRRDLWHASRYFSANFRNTCAILFRKAAEPAQLFSLLKWSRIICSVVQVCQQEGKAQVYALG